MVLINTNMKTNEHLAYRIVAYKNNHLHAVSVLGKAFVLLYHLHLKTLH